MKKLFTIILVGILVLFSALLTTAMTTQDQSSANHDKELGDFSIIDTVEPVPAPLKTGFDSITGKEADSYLRFFASDLLEGRETAGKGIAMAAEYVVSMFRAWGIRPAGDSRAQQRSYYQEVEIRQIRDSSGRVTVTHTQDTQGAQAPLVRTWLFDADKDYVFRPSLYPSAKGTISAAVVFAGYGIQEGSLSYDDYKAIDIRGKIVMVLMGVPAGDNPGSPFNKAGLKEKYLPGERSLERELEKVSLARNKGAAAILLVESKPSIIYREKLDKDQINDTKPPYSGQARPLLKVDATFQEQTQAPYMRISPEMANIILGFAGKTREALGDKIDKELKPLSFVLPGVSLEIESRFETKLARCRNVLGCIEGSDPVLRDELVVIGAHLDHLGKEGNYIYNGADDNASGSAALLEIAQAFAANPVKPKRSILFAFWTGEEWDYQGSSYYVKQPTFPLKKTLAYLNLDMLSREWTWPHYVETLQNYHGKELPQRKPDNLVLTNFLPIEVLRGSGLKTILAENNRYVGLHTHFIEVPSVILGSDHLPFDNHHIPWINSYGGDTPDYHTPFDSVDKVNANLIEKGTRLAWLTAFSIADKVN